jgi:hypothetical protein
VYQAAVPTGEYVAIFSTSNAVFWISKGSNDRVGYDSPTGAGVLYAYAGNLLGAWHHIAWTRHGDVWRVFVDGVQRGSTGVSGAGFYVGQIGTQNYPMVGNNPLVGALSNVRITIGAGVYATNFTPPAAPFPTYR